ncbi:MAG: FliM/FliN family flagellar motor switch protein [Candidatus Desulfofervidus auxilii]|nr:FliM/FliN family flagellar motor switch protein [Candidatus Desulfofervidus auxilii]
MSQILTEKEVEVLQKALSEKQVSLEGEKRVPKVQKYDFIVQKRITPRIAAILNVVFNRFLVNFRASLSLKLRRVIRMQLLPFDNQKFNELTEGLPPVCWLEIIEIAPLPGQCLFIINPELVSVLVDLLCGGNGKRPTKEIQAVFAPLEQSVMNKIVVLALKDLESAWETVMKVKVKSVGLEFNPQLLTGFSPDDYFCLIPVKVTLGEFNSMMAFGLPHYTLEPLKEQFLEKKEVQPVDQEAMQKLLNHLLDTEVEVTVELATKEMRLKDIMEMEREKIIDLNKSLSEEVIVKVEGMPLFKGYPVQFKGNKAVKISEVLKSFSLEEEVHETNNTKG